MPVKSAQAVVGTFTTANPATAAAQNGDELPTGILYVDGTANGASVTVTNKDVGAYSFSVTLPALTAGQIVGLRISAVVAGVAGTAIVWQDSADTYRTSDVETAVLLALKVLRNKVVTNPTTGVMTVYDDNGSDALYTANIYEDVAGTVPFDGTGANRRDRLA